VSRHGGIAGTDPTQEQHPMRKRRSLIRLIPILITLAAGAAIFRQPAADLHAGRLAGIVGAGASGIQVQNLDPANNANVVVDFYKQGGGPPVTRVLPALLPLQAYSVYLPAEANLSNGAYAAIVSSDRPITTMTRTNWSSSGGSITHTDIEASTAVLVPTVHKNDAGHASIINIQNTDTSAAATATVELMASGSNTPSVSIALTINPGTSTTVDLGKHSAFASLPDGFRGWARITAAVPLAVVATTDITTSAKGVYAVDGIPETSTSATLTAPMVMNSVEGTTSGMVVLNPGTTPVDVNLSYTGISGSCAGQTIAHDAASIGAGERVVFYQADIPIPGTGRSHLPQGCAAAARIVATGPVAAVVSLANLSEGTSAAYGALRTSQAGPQVMLPLIRRNFFGNSEVHVVNTSSSAATVTLEYAGTVSGQQRPFESCGPACQVTIPGGGGHRWAFADLVNFLDKSYGSARLISDQPLLATVSETNTNSSGVRMANDAAYNGTAMGAGAPTPSMRRHIPLALQGVGDPPPTRTPGGQPTPTAGGQQPPTATPDTGGAGISGAGVSGIQVVNMSRTTAADITVDFHSHAGGPAVQINLVDVPPGSIGNLYLPSQTELQNGVYAARISSDQPVGAIGRTDWPASSAALFSNTAEEGTDIVLPLLMRDYNGQTSIVAVHNADTDAASTVQFQVIPLGQTTPLATLSLDLPAGGGATVDMGGHPGLAGLPANLSAWGRLTAGAPIAVSSVVGNPVNKGVYDVAGVPAGRAAATLNVPMAYNQFPVGDAGSAGGSLTSGISVLNPGTGPVSVKVSYRGADSGGRANACQGQTVEHGGGATAVIAAGSSQVFYQGDVDIPGSGRSGLPAGCAASAVIQATGGTVLATVNVVNDAPSSPAFMSSAAYPAVAGDQGAERLYLSMIRRDHVLPAKLGTPIQVQNLGTAAASVTLTLRNSLGNIIACGADCTATIAPQGSRLWWPADLTAFPAGNYGSALIDSDQPVAAALLDFSETGFYDQAIYLGIPESDQREATLPMVLRGWRIGVPVPPRPTPTPGGPATPTPAVTRRPTGTPNPDGVLGLAGASGIEVMNMSASDAADITIDFSSQTGGPPVTLTRPGIAPGDSAVIYLPAEVSLARDVYAARVSADQPIAALVRDDWNATGHALMYNAPQAATEVLIAYLLNDFAGQTSIVSIQNTDPSAGTTAELQVMRSGETAPVATLQLPLDAGGATTLSLGTHPQLVSLPSGALDGLLWGRVIATRPVAVLSTVATNSPRGVYDIPGVPASDAASTLHIPMLAHQYAVDPANPAAGKITTGVNMLNPGPNTVNARMTYRGADTPGRSNACQGQTIQYGGGAPMAIAPGQVLAFYQGMGDLPANCAVSGVIEVTGGSIVAVANITNADLGSSASYGVVTAGQGSQRVHLPMVRNKHTGAQITTPIQVQNLGGSAASVTLEVKDNRGVTIDCGADCTATIPPNGSRLWWPSDIAAWPANSYGSAIVTSDQPVAAIVADMSFAGLQDIAAYHGLVDNGQAMAALPLLLAGGWISAVPPILGPTPAPPLVGLPNRMPAPVGDRIDIPVSFDSGDHQIAEIELTLDYDQSWLRFDTTDGDGDGVPDAVDLALPDGFAVKITHDAASANGELMIRVSSLGGTPKALPDGSWLTLSLVTAQKPGTSASGIAFGPNKGVKLRDLAGNEVSARTSGGWSPNSQRVVYLPALHKVSVP
jgi:hypothetical protein